MATLRLFAGLREIAGTARLEVDGETVDAVLAGAVSRFGPRFSEGLSTARVWVNGEEADPTAAVGPLDEVAVIPPVSGGAVDAPARPRSGVAFPLGALALLVLARISGNTAWWAAAVVGLSTAWALDVAATLATRARDVPVVPMLITVVGTVVSTHLLGPAGLGVGLFIAVAATLGWGVASDTSRVLASLAPAFVIALVAGTATGSLYLADATLGPGGAPAAVFLVMAVVATGLYLLAARFSHLPFADPFTATAVGAVASSLVAAAVWNLDLVTFLVVGVVMGASFVAGRGLGSILRTRQVMLLDTAPGLMALLDGAVLAAGLYYPVLALVG